MQKRLKWSVRADRDADRIAQHYLDTASPGIADLAVSSIEIAVSKLANLPVVYRAGKGNTREYVMKRFPYTIIYRATDKEVRIVRILHQARSYFN